MGKQRLDALLVSRGIFESRAKAQAYIMSGAIRVNGRAVAKPGRLTDEDATIEVVDDAIPYVSRGGMKLEGALRDFGISVKDKVALDAGASTGGFTDCLLQNGARRVYAVDVGYGQLAWKLRLDQRVKVMERTNLRYVRPEDIGEPVDICTLDLSFISLKKVWPNVKELLNPGGEMVSLIKPQFEAGRDLVGKKGVVRDPKVHVQVLSSMLENALEIGYRPLGMSVSPVRGPGGNIEFWFYTIKPGTTESDATDSHDNRRYGTMILSRIPSMVESSHRGEPYAIVVGDI